jgi:hypothetical protein
MLPMLLALAYKVVMFVFDKTVIDAAKGAFGSTLGSSLGTWAVGTAAKALSGSGQETLVTLQQSPNPKLAVTVQNSLASHFQANPSAFEEAKTTVQRERPTDWEWVEKFSAAPPINFDWENKFRISFESILGPWADALKQRYNLSDQQTEYERTQECPIGHHFAMAKYWRTGGDGWLHEVKATSSLLLGVESSPYGNVLERGDVAMCDEGHQWPVFAA